VISKLKNRAVRFIVEDGCLVRTVTSDAGDGRGYTHRCDKAVFETVAHAMDEVPPEGEGTTLTEIVRQEKLPYTQVNVALEFLKERGIVEVRHRRCYPASPAVHLDAMVEYHALREKGAEGG
jgi:hypothetical protein